MSNLESLCRACLLICPENSATFESLKTIFRELTLLRISDNDDLPRYLCPSCSTILLKFKDFKDTCIKSDEHLRKVTFSPLKQELEEPFSTSPEPIFESVKVESQSCDEQYDDNEDELPKTKKERKASRRKVGKRKRKSVDEKYGESSGSIVKPKPEESPEESDEELNEPLMKKEKTAQSGIKVEAGYQRRHKCTVSNCRKCYRTADMLEAHIKTHSGIDSTICDICEKPLASMTIMLRHRLTHRSVEERSYKCAVCYRVMVNENSLKNHMKTHDATKSHVCDVCGMSFPTSWVLKNHKQTHNVDQPFQCKLCPKSYRTYLSLYGHVKQKHEKECPVQCNICGIVVPTKKFLFRHCKITHTVYTTTENVYQCKQCDVKCKTMSSLKNHERLHTGERKYKCPLCPKSYAHSAILKKHSYSHTGERPVHCDECGKGFLQKYALDVHMNVHKKQWIAQGIQGITLMGKSKVKKEVATTSTVDCLANVVKYDSHEQFSSDFM